MNRRIVRELKDLQSKPSDWFTVSLIDDNIFSWHVTIIAPDGKGELVFDFKLPQDYPFHPPKIHSDTKIDHPFTRRSDGCICIPDGKWRPQLKMENVFEGIRSLLAGEDPDLFDCRVFLLFIVYSLTEKEIVLKSPSGKTIVFEVGPDNTVEDIKVMIQDRKGIPTNSLRILYAGEVLNDGLLLRDVKRSCSTYT